MQAVTQCMSPYKFNTKWTKDGDNFTSVYVSKNDILVKFNQNKNENMAGALFA